jgi:hypothetical protein
MTGDQQERMTLLSFNAEKIEQIYLQGKERGRRNPTVLVLDLRDQGGALIAETFAGNEKVQELVADAAAKKDDVALAEGAEPPAKGRRRKAVPGPTGKLFGRFVEFRTGCSTR